MYNNIDETRGITSFIGTIFVMKIWRFLMF